MIPFNLRFRSRLRAAFFVPAIGVALAAVLSIYPPSVGHAQFVAQQTFAVASGTGNALTVSIPNYVSYQKGRGIELTIAAGLSNTGPTTIAVNNLSPVPIYRPTSIGYRPFSGGEIIGGEYIKVVGNGSFFVLTSNIDMTPIGATVEYRGTAQPRGTLVEDGSCVSRSIYEALFAVIGESHGACDGSTTFALPDSRGTTIAALDNQGGNGAANRITLAGSGCNATVVGTCGSQSTTLAAANLPSHSHNGSGSTGINSVDHSHAYSGTSGGNLTTHSHAGGGNTGLISNDHNHTGSGSTGNPSNGHTHSGAGTTGNMNANNPHAHTSQSRSGVGRSQDGTSFTDLWNGAGGSFGTSSTDISHGHDFSFVSGFENQSHTHAYSFTTSGVSANHTHAYSFITGNEDFGHLHNYSGTTNGASANHVHAFSMTTDGGNGLANTAFSNLGPVSLARRAIKY